MTRLTTCPDVQSVAERAAAHVERALAQAREQRGVAHLVLSGGNSPERTYELLGERPAVLEGTHVWFADERCVAPDSEESNYRMARETLLDPARIPPERVHRMPGEIGPSPGAESYELELLATLGEDPAPPVLDVIVLGIGPDAHIASLFPSSPLLDAGGAAICHGVTDSPKPPPQRITLSLAVLRAARDCLLLASGAEKSDAIDAMLGEPSRHVPASLLRRERLTVIVDDAAAPPGPHP
jgi:6-phosphogluconolactonase